MNKQELSVIFSQLATEGWKPRLCSEFRYDEMEYETNGSMCADGLEQIMMLPPEELSMHPTGAITVIDNSMIDADIKKGDTLLLMYSGYYEDGDVVLAQINGKLHIRCYNDDGNGNIWLVPKNDKYEAVRMNDVDIIIHAVAQRYIRRVPRQPYMSNKKAIDKLADGMNNQPKVLTDAQVSWVIQTIGPTITIARMWFAVFRALTQKKYYTMKEFEAFTMRVRAELPNHLHLPSTEEMQKMDVLSFSKKIEEWQERFAPVSGKRFYKYKNVGERTLGLLDAVLENSLETLQNSTEKV